MIDTKSPLDLMRNKLYFENDKYGLGPIVTQLINELAEAKGWDIESLREEAEAKNAESAAAHKAELERAKKERQAKALAKQRKNFIKKRGYVPELLKAERPYTYIVKKGVALVKEFPSLVVKDSSNRTAYFKLKRLVKDTVASMDSQGFPIPKGTGARWFTVFDSPGTDEHGEAAFGPYCSVEVLMWEIDAELGHPSGGTAGYINVLVEDK